MSKYEPIVQELVDKLNSDAPFKQAMQDSLDLVNKLGVDDFQDLGITSLNGYLKYMNEYLHWIPTEDSTGSNVFKHICSFYFIIDMPPVREWQNPIDPSQKAPWYWLSDWLIRYAQEMGSWMDSPESITQESVDTFNKADIYHMQDYPVPEYGWRTFNEFFARHIDPSKRPIAAPNDDTVIVSPADCTFDGTWVIRDPEADVTTFDVKGVPWVISDLLKDSDSGSDYGPLFAGGTFTHSFLGPSDYHRQHAPVSGTVIEARIIPGICYLEVILRESTKRRGGYELGMHRYLRHMDDRAIPQKQRGTPLPGVTRDVVAPDRPGYQFLQARALILIDNPALGLVAVLPIGMAQVSSVVLSVKPGDQVDKGQEISCFQFGGSDIVMVFQKKASVKFDQQVGTHYNFGNQVATGVRTEEL